MPTPPTPKRSAADRPDTPGGGEPLRDFSRSLPMALLRAREAVMARFRPMLRAHDITEQQWRVLRALASAAGPLQPSELAAQTFLSLPSLSRLLKTLETRGVIRRGLHASDQRASLLAITRSGRALIAAVGPRSEAHYAEIAARLGPDDVEQLYRLLDGVVARLGTPEPGESND